jgi:hypothetical protein
MYVCMYVYMCSVNVRIIIYAHYISALVMRRMVNTKIFTFRHSRKHTSVTYINIRALHTQTYVRYIHKHTFVTYINIRSLHKHTFMLTCIHTHTYINTCSFVHAWADCCPELFMHTYIHTHTHRVLLTTIKLHI